MQRMTQVLDVDGWIDGWIGGWIDGRMNGCMDGWMDSVFLSMLLVPCIFNTFHVSQFNTNMPWMMLIHRHAKLEVARRPHAVVVVVTYVVKVNAVDLLLTMVVVAAFVALVVATVVVAGVAVSVVDLLVARRLRRTIWEKR